MTRYIRKRDSDTKIPFVETPENMKEGYIFDSNSGVKEINGWHCVFDSNGVAHAARDLRVHNVPNTDEVIDYVTNHYVYQGNGTHRRFERRDDKKIEVLTELVAKLIAGQPVTMQDVEAGQHNDD